MKRSFGGKGYLVVFSLLFLFLSACGEIQKSAINGVLDARDAAVSSRDAGAFSQLLLKDYNDNGQTKITVVARMLDLFARFEAMEMKSFDRKIILLDENHAQCMQSYRLRVRKDGQWREMVQREQLFLTRTPAGWRISGGL